MQQTDRAERVRRVANVLWPSFVVGGLANGVFFTLFDPEDLLVFGEPLAASRLALYTVGFFSFWLIAACSSALTCLFQRGADEVNRCPLPAVERPTGCPRREDPGRGAV